jgi:hypothetical protein
MNVFENFKAKWTKEELKTHSGKGREEIVKCFKKFGVTPTEELLALYCTIDGKDCMDKEYFRLWSLNEIDIENSSERELERTMRYGVLFADYCVSCWCFRINRKGEVLIDYFSDNVEPRVKSSSITEFFKLMQECPDDALM